MRSKVFGIFITEPKLTPNKWLTESESKIPIFYCPVCEGEIEMNLIGGGGTNLEDGSVDPPDGAECPKCGCIALIDLGGW